VEELLNPVCPVDAGCFVQLLWYGLNSDDEEDHVVTDPLPLGDRDDGIDRRAFFPQPSVSKVFQPDNLKQLVDQPGIRTINQLKGDAHYGDCQDRWCEKSITEESRPARP